MYQTRFDIPVDIPKLHLLCKMEKALLHIIYRNKTNNHLQDSD